MPPLSRPSIRPTAPLSPYPSRRGRSRTRGVTLVEFALMAPLVFFILLGLVIGAIVVTNQVQIGNAVRDGARAAAICGGQYGQSLPHYDATPSDWTCSTTNLTKYIQSRVTAIPATINFTVTVVLLNGASGGTDIASCPYGASVHVTGSFQQPLYLPLVGRFLGDNGSNLRTLTATAEATCEQ